MLNVDFAAGGLLESGTVNLFVDPGLVQLTGARLDVRELVVGADVDFKAQQISVHDTRFNVGGVAGQLVGRADYQRNDLGRLTKLNFAMTGNGARVELPRLMKHNT